MKTVIDRMIAAILIITFLWLIVGSVGGWYWEENVYQEHVVVEEEYEGNCGKAYDENGEPYMVDTLGFKWLGIIGLIIFGFAMSVVIILKIFIEDL